MKKVAIVGCGGIAQVHGWVLANMEDVEIKALCDTDIDKCRALLQKYDIDAKITTNYRELLTSDLDAVHICTPHVLHAPMSTEFLRSGKAVFAEKPCAVSMEQFEIMKDVEKEHSGKLGFCFQNRYNETTLLADRLIKKGRIGHIRGVRAVVTWRRDNDYYATSPWKGRLETEGGGVLINQSIHTLDLLLRYMGTPKIIKGSIANHHLPEEEVEDTVEAWMESVDGVRGCFYASNGYAMDAPVFLEIQGDQGRISLNGQEVSVYADNSEPEHILCEKEQGIGKDYWGCGHKECIRDFYHCLDSGDRFQNDLEGVENTFRTMMKIYEEGRSRGDSN